MRELLTAHARHHMSDYNDIDEGARSKFVSRVLEFCYFENDYGKINYDKQSDIEFNFVLCYFENGYGKRDCIRQSNIMSF